MKTILLIVPTLIQGGFERICIQTANYLKNSANVKIVLFDSTKNFYDTGDIEIIDMNKPVKESRVGKALNVVSRAFALSKIKREQKADVALSFGTSAALPNVISFNSKCKKWIAFHSYMDFDNPRKTRFIGKHADRNLCCSRGIAEELKKITGCSNVETLYNPYEIDEIVAKSLEETPELPITKEDICLATVGRDDEIKGYWHLIKAFSLFAKEIPHSKLMIIGMGEFKECKKLVDDLGLIDKVIFTGVKKNPYAYLKQADVFVLSSINEGFPNVMIEALALSKPVVSTDCLTGPAEILIENGLSMDTKEIVWGDYGVLVPRVKLNNNYNPEDIEPEDRYLAEGLLSLVKDKEKMKKYSDKANKRARDFSSDRYVNKLIKA